MIIVSQASAIDAPSCQVYGILADYRVGHPSILPKRWFRSLRIVSGSGVGAGTVISFDMHVAGRTRTASAVVKEPEPGRVLTEFDVERGILTTFTVAPTTANRCIVTIETKLPERTGIFGHIERMFTTAVLRRIYREELSMLAAVVA